MDQPHASDASSTPVDNDANLMDSVHETSAFAADDEQKPRAVSAHPPHLEYEPIPYRCIETELEALNEVHESVKLAWEQECELYGQTMQLEMNSNGRTEEVPRRNYFNPQGTVRDERLFPYHDSCYSLIDAYDCLYYEKRGQQQPMPENSFRMDSESLLARTISPNPLVGFDMVQEFMPASVQAIQISLLGVLPHAVSSNAEFWTELDRWGSSSGSSQPVGEEDRPSCLPKSRAERASLLLKLLQHALSDLQRDLKLAAAVLYALSKHCDLDEIAVFRRVLVILDAECKYVQCHCPCENTIHQEIPHHCVEFRSFYEVAVQNIFIRGISHLTREHAVCVAAFVRWGYLREFGSLIEKNVPEETVEGRRKQLLKRAVGTLRAEDDEAEYQQIPVNLLHNILVGLGERARVERNHLTGIASSREEMSRSEILNRLGTYHNCVKTLVNAAFSTIQVLPENERFYGIAGLLLFSIVQSVVAFDLRREDRGFLNLDYSTLDYVNRSGLEYETGPRDCETHTKSSSLILPFRFAERIGNSTFRPKKSLEDNATVDLLKRFELSFSKEPPDNIRTAIRGLFLKNLIDVRAVGFGYGDCMLWCRFDISPLDPILFWHSYAYPFEDEGDDSSDEDDEEDVDRENEDADWEVDETGRILTKGEIRARYDLSLLMLARSWQAPWSPESHASFQPAFRDAVKTIALCTHRLGFPHEIIQQVASFLPRDGWSDTRQQCWSFECCVDTICKTVSRTFTEQQREPSQSVDLKYCEKCHFSSFCTKKECYENEFKLGHKRSCGRPPFLSTAPDDGEVKFCVEIFKDAPNSIPSTLTRISTAIENEGKTLHEDEAMGEEDGWGGIEDDNDDDGSWETMDSDEDEAVAPSNTAIIYKYFRQKTYDPL